jgi:hypothetical protein
VLSQHGCYSLPPHSKGPAEKDDGMQVKRAEPSHWQYQSIAFFCIMVVSMAGAAPTGHRCI